MARNIERYGYGPNRTSDTPAVMLFEHTRKLRNYWSGMQSRRIARASEPDAAPPDEPLTHGMRCFNYVKDNRTPQRGFTPRQKRRLRHKSKVGAVAYAAGVRA